MSSIIVKGMKMPDSCAVCRFAGRGGYFMERIVCMFTGKNEDAENVDRLSDCPLVALPNKHGRLVDADALRDRLRNLADDDWNANTTTTWSEAFSECDDMVDDAPTIVEKES